MKIFLLVPLAFIVAAQTVDATKCYKCPKKDDVSCSSDEDDWQTCKTKQSEGQCLTLTTDVPLVGKNVQRDCGGPKGEFPIGCTTKGPVKTCVCEGDLCNGDGGNGAFKAQASIVGMIMLITFLQCYLI